MITFRLSSSEATNLGRQTACLLQSGDSGGALGLLAPLLCERIRFPLLERVGAPLGDLPPAVCYPFLEQVASLRSEGGWVVIGSALRSQLAFDLPGALAHSRDFTILADVWYGADILGERVPGPALLTDFPAALGVLSAWRSAPNAWVRRSVGVAVHFWAKRSLGAPACLPQAAELLALLDPLFEEHQIDAIKGIGWGLKTLGRYYPALVSAWLDSQPASRRPTALMVRKARKYLPR